MELDLLTLVPCKCLFAAEQIPPRPTIIPALQTHLAARTYYKSPVSRERGYPNSKDDACLKSWDNNAQ